VRGINLACIIFSFFIFSCGSKSFAQLFKKKPLSPAKMCYALGKKRTKKIRKKIRIGKKEQNISRISYKPHEANITRPSLRKETVKKEDILSVPELITMDNNEKPGIETLPDPINDRQAEIRKQVLENMENGKATDPIMESLYFITDEAEFAYVDFDPFLLAVEYALQGKMVLVEGHTDDRGEEQHNLDLSMERVRQIERLMHDIGVPEENVSVIGYGESMPKYDNSTEEVRQKNRRVDFKIF
jgi:outer membrane protein OmpA-like peptidoglycan-associated protein